MKNARKTIIKLIIAVIAVINLGLLLIFEYGLSDKTPAVLAAQQASEKRAALHSQEAAESAAADEASGASSESGEGAEASDGSSADAGSSAANESAGGASSGDASSNSGASDNAGVSEADAAAGSDGGSADNGSAAAGSGKPTINVAYRLPEIDAASLPDLARTLIDLGYLSADDGYGNNVTDQITADYEEIEGDAEHYRVTFTVTNQAGETDVKTKTITVKNSTLPILELTSHTATLEVGATFNFYSYIKTARDIDGSSLNDNISISGTVDTSRRGTYQVVYSTISRVSLEKVEKTLTVRVG